MYRPRSLHCSDFNSLSAPMSRDTYDGLGSTNNSRKRDQALMVAGSSIIVVGDPCPKKATGVNPFSAMVDPTMNPLESSCHLLVMPSGSVSSTSQLFSCCWAPSCQEYLLQHVSSAARLALVYQRVDLEP